MLIKRNIIGEMDVFGGDWQFSDAANLSDWFEANLPSTITTPNSTVTAWRNRTASSSNVLATGAGSPVHTGSSVDFLNGNHTLIDSSLANTGISNGSCMIYVVFDTDKVASHYILNYDTGGSNPGLALRYWQPSNSWFVYCDNTGSTANISASAAGTAAGQKVLLGLLINGTTLSISVNGVWTTGGVAAIPFVASRLIINRSGASLGEVSDIVSYTAYNAGDAQRIEGVLAAKHGIALPNGHPYKVLMPSSAWNHSDDPGLKIWYDLTDASTVTLVGSNISQLLNKAAAGGYTLAQVTDIYRPSWDGATATGRGNASTAGLSITASIPWTNSAYLLLSSSKYGGFNGSFPREYVVKDAGDTLNYHSRVISNVANNLIARVNNAAGSTGEFTVESGYTADSVLVIRSIVFDGNALGIASTWKNGTATTGASGANVNPVTGAIFRILTANAINITLASFVVTSSTSTAIRQKHEGIMAWNKGMQASLDVSHPYKSRPPLLTD